METNFNPFENKQTAVTTYLKLRRFIGYLGFLLPIVCIASSYLIPNCGEAIHKSISDYYFTPIRDLFVGILCAVAFFLFAYKGSLPYDTIFASIGGLCALGIAFFPTSVQCELDCNASYDLLFPNASMVHFISALLFFGILVYFSLWSFVKDPDEKANSNWKQKKILYKICGFTMLFCVLAIAAYFLFYLNDVDYTDKNICKESPLKYNLIFWLETLALFAFGISWIAKGQFKFKNINPLTFFK
ncbi:hypothetical protein [Flavicella sediminum]|uniref:hypothetical protein n=1 Tax=Flavicella sediminum TaxID=2585141 RepID=UPI001120E935|nr:hypothetical protein [Flavicella sediminum]